MSNETRFSEQRDTLERLRNDMEQAKAQYEEARDAYLIGLNRYVDPADPPLAQAKLMYEFSMEMYKGAILRFNKLVIRGEMPGTAAAG